MRKDFIDANVKRKEKQLERKRAKEAEKLSQACKHDIDKALQNNKVDCLEVVKSTQRGGNA